MRRPPPSRWPLHLSWRARFATTLGNSSECVLLSICSPPYKMMGFDCPLSAKGHDPARPWTLDMSGLAPSFVGLRINFSKYGIQVLYVSAHLSAPCRRGNALLCALLHRCFAYRVFFAHATFPHADKEGGWDPKVKEEAEEGLGQGQHLREQQGTVWRWRLSAHLSFWSCR
jgi:hypothetical protein